MWNLPVCSSCSSEHVSVQELFCTTLLSQENTLIRIFVVTNDKSHQIPFIRKSSLMGDTPHKGSGGEGRCLFEIEQDIY